MPATLAAQEVEPPVLTVFGEQEAVSEVTVDELEPMAMVVEPEMPEFCEEVAVMVAYPDDGAVDGAT